MFRRYFGMIAVAGLLSLGFVGFSEMLNAQSAAVALSGRISPDDAFPYVLHGVPSARTLYTTPGAISGTPVYSNGGAQLTAWTHTMGDTEVNFFIQPAGTLATGTLTTAANPGDGQRECFLSTQTQTAITWTANTGQSLANAPTAGVAMTPQCMTYQKSAATWYRSP